MLDLIITRYRTLQEQVQEVDLLINQFFLFLVISGKWLLTDLYCFEYDNLYFIL